MTFQDWQARYTRLRTIAERIDARRYAQANRLFTAAGVGIYRNVATNAMIARDAGRPWAEVDYSLLRRALRVDASRFEGYRIVDRWNARTWPAVQASVAAAGRGTR